tara:strand:- start:833 stop:1156 length:324 start_codon:yes stop_codon:yes gene_type:complete
MELTITISDADVERLADAISARLLGATSVPAPVIETVPAEAPKRAEPGKPNLSLGDLRGLAKELVSAKGAKGRDTLVSILGSYGAKNLTTLDEDRFNEVADSIKAAM